MIGFIHIMTLPFLACLILAGIYTYLGLHVIERGVIFVDLALAQIAALGASMLPVFGKNDIGFSAASKVANIIIISELRNY